jgi:hypothetical protein
MHEFRQYLEEIDLSALIDGSGDISLQEPDIAKMRGYILSGFDRLLSLEGSCVGKKGLVMAHGPTLLQINKQDYDQHVKITCNDFHKIEFLNDFVPDFWCAANSYDALKEPFGICMDKNIDVLISVPRKCEFLKLVDIAERKEKLDLVSPWLWEIRMLQLMLAKKYKCTQPYSHCNTVTNHMIAFALWLGCAPIHIAGFDMSYIGSREKGGASHAGYNDSTIQVEPFTGQEKAKAIADLRYLCKIARSKNIKIYNLAHEINNLPYTLTFKE